MAHRANTEAERGLERVVKESSFRKTESIMQTNEPIRFNVHYQDHHIEEIWERLPHLYCPLCGWQNVWHENDPGDYYVGEKHMCSSCGAGWYLPEGVNHDELNDPQGKQRFDHIRKQEMER